MKAIINFTEKECITFLSENYGLRGYNKTGITLNPKNRTIDNLRKECLIQSKIK